MNDRVLAHFEQSIEVKQASRALAGNIAAAAGVIVQSLSNGGKVLSCGNGGSAADAQHFPAEQCNRINHAQAQKDLEKILQRYVTNVIPAVSEGTNCGRKTEDV